MTSAEKAKDSDGRDQRSWWSCFTTRSSEKDRLATDDVEGQRLSTAADDVSTDSHSREDAACWRYCLPYSCTPPPLFTLLGKSFSHIISPHY